MSSPELRTYVDPYGFTCWFVLKMWNAPSYGTDLYKSWGFFLGKSYTVTHNMNIHISWACAILEKNPGQIMLQKWRHAPVG